MPPDYASDLGSALPAQPVVSSKSPPRFLGGSKTYNEALQLLALILADDIAIKRRDFHRDFVLGHFGGQAS